MTDQGGNVDQELLKLFTKLKVLGKKQGLDLDILSLSSDRQYAAVSLRKLSNADDPDLVAAAIEAMDRLGLLNQPADKSREEEPPKDKYIHTLR